MKTIRIAIPLGVTARDLANVTNAIVGLFAEVSEAVNAQQVTELRLKGHGEGSLLMELGPQLDEDASEESVDAVFDSMIKGLVDLSEGEEPLFYSRAALMHTSLLIGSFTTAESAVEGVRQV